MAFSYLPIPPAQSGKHTQQVFSLSDRTTRG